MSAVRASRAERGQWPGMGRRRKDGEADSRGRNGNKGGEKEKGVKTTGGRRDKRNIDA